MFADYIIIFKFSEEIQLRWVLEHIQRFGEFAGFNIKSKM